MMTLNVTPLRHAELAAAIDRGRAVEVAHFCQLIDRRLGPRRQRGHHPVELPAAAVRPGQNETGTVQPAGFLPRHLPGQESPPFGIHGPIAQGRGHVPGFGDDAVRSLRGVQRMSKQNHAVAVPGCGDSVDRAPRAIVIELEMLALDAPTLAAHRAGEYAHEAEAGRKLPPEPFQVHGDRRRTQGRAVRVGSSFRHSVFP